jgi:N6-adenosine-specific RNA methylase IME4
MHIVTKTIKGRDYWYLAWNEKCDGQWRKRHRYLANSEAAARCKIKELVKEGELSKFEGDHLLRQLNGAPELDVLEAAQRRSRRIVAHPDPFEIPPLPTQKYQCLVVDPPWKYELRANDKTHRNRIPYPPMETEEILALPVLELCDRTGAVLWLWTTNNFMAEAYNCIKRWGMSPKTILTWVKTTKAGGVHIGVGHWLRNATEHCIIATRGEARSFRHLRTLTNQSTVLMAPRREHSRKPEVFYTLVEQLCPVENRLELFARQRRPGWESWGNEVDKFDAG